MSHIQVQIRIRLLSDTIFSSGNSIPGGEDIALRTDSQGRPFLAGSTLKGLLRESMTNLLCWTGTQPEETIVALFGTEGSEELDLRRRIIFGDLRLDDPSLDLESCSSLRTFTKLSDGVVETGSLRMAACLHRGLVFQGTLFCHSADYPLIQEAAQAIQWLGLSRNRGFGHVQIQAVQTEHSPVALAPVDGWIRYRLRVQSPLVISWLSQSGTSAENKRNFFQSRSYLPGSTVRGMVASYLADTDPQWFADHKDALLRQVRFHDALPVADGTATIPTPMGFYEDKEKTRFYSVLRQDVIPGDKRAKVGRYCRIEDGRLVPASPAMETLLRINLASEDKQIFTVRAMAAGTELEGYIHADDTALLDRICTAFRSHIWLGGKKFAGCGLCQVLELPSQAPDHLRYSYGPEDTVPTELYMLLLSPTTMTRDTETVGIDEAQLARALGVGSVEILRCATAVGEYAGFNRTWGCSDPLITMYEPGSLFRLRCDVAPTVEAIRRLELQGIGARKAFGHGSVLFLKDYPSIKAPDDPGDARSAPSREAAIRQARCRWLLRQKAPAGLSPSQLGDLQALCESILDDKSTTDDLRAYLDHNTQNRGPKIAKRYEQIRQQVLQILEQPLGQTIGLSDCDDSVKARLRLICDLIDLSRKE